MICIKIRKNSSFPNRKPNFSYICSIIWVYPRPVPPIKGIRGRFKGLPPFVADSLPDRWGSKVFASWCQQQKINPNEITPLDFLLYLGKRGMGALEFEPAYDLDAKGIDEIRNTVRQFPEIARKNEVAEALIGEIASYLGNG